MDKKVNLTLKERDFEEIREKGILMRIVINKNIDRSRMLDYTSFCIK